MKNKEKPSAQPKKEEEKKRGEKKDSQQKKAETKITKGIKRIAGKDVSGDLVLERALLQVKGIGPTIVKAAVKVICDELKISPHVQIGDLSDEQIEKIDSILFNLHKYNIPSFLFNRRKDLYDGSDKHVIMNDLDFVVKQAIEREKNMFSWKGFRHAYGQKVRGQRTRNTGRTGLTVGVMRKAVLQTQQKAQPAKAQQQKEEKK